MGSPDPAGTRQTNSGGVLSLIPLSTKRHSKKRENSLPTLMGSEGRSSGSPAMAGISIHHDGGLPHLHNHLDSYRGPTPDGAADREAELRRLFHQIYGGFSKDPTDEVFSEILRSESPSRSTATSDDRSELFDRWIQKFRSGTEEGPYDRTVPDLKARIERPTGKLRDETLPSSMRRCESRDPLSDMLMVLKGVAVGPCEPRVTDSDGARKWEDQILRCRQALILRTSGVRDVEEFPYRKKQRTTIRRTSCKCVSLFLENPHSEHSGCPGSREMLNQYKQRPRRTYGLLREHNFPRKRIPVGVFFQADVPEWKELPVKRESKVDNEALDDSRWLGTQIWPIEADDKDINGMMIGKGRTDTCTCSSPGSISCIRLHVITSRLHLKSELGWAFFRLGFDGVDEEVLGLWTHDEQMRRMSNMTRMATGAVDSDDDENTGNGHDGESSGGILQDSYAAYSQRCLKRKH